MIENQPKTTVDAPANNTDKTCRCLISLNTAIKLIIATNNKIIPKTMTILPPCITLLKYVSLFISTHIIHYHLFYTKIGQLSSHINKKTYINGELFVNFKLNGVPLGPLSTNCYIIEKEKSALIIDPGGDYDYLKAHIENNKLNVEAILLTHAHFDHIGAVDQLRTDYNVEVYMHELEKDWLTDPSLNGSGRYIMDPTSASNPPVHLIEEGPFSVGSFQLSVLHTTGHSPGSLSFYLQDAGILIAGDTLFHRSIGRTDLPFGNHDELIKSIQEKILTLPENTICFPGHGPETTVKDEKELNPFLN